MGRSRRPQPIRLAAKLKEIRVKLDLSQTGMAERLNRAKPAPRRGHITEYEWGKREPSLAVLLEYARVAGVPMEVLVDDDLDLPKRLPVMPRQKLRSKQDGE